MSNIKKKKKILKGTNILVFEHNEDDEPEPESVKSLKKIEEEENKILVNIPNEELKIEPDILGSNYL